MPFLIHYHNGTPISHIELEDYLSIGRGDDNTLQLADATVSTQHACVEKTDGGRFRMRDLGSTNGILYRGEKVAERLLDDGDLLVIGTHELEFVAVLPEPLQKTARIRKSWIPGVYYTSD